MQVQNALWDGALQALKDWDQEVVRGKALLEARQTDLEPCLLRLVIHSPEPHNRPNAVVPPQCGKPGESGALCSQLRT